MIRLTKPIKRELLAVQQHGKHRGKSLIVELLPGDEISFRTKGTKKAFTIFLGHCYRMAQILTLESDYKIKLEEYTRRKKIGERVKRPKRPMMPFDKIYFDALKK